VALLSAVKKFYRPTNELFVLYVYARRELRIACNHLTAFDRVDISDWRLKHGRQICQDLLERLRSPSIQQQRLTLRDVVEPYYDDLLRRRPSHRPHRGRRRRQGIAVGLGIGRRRPRLSRHARCRGSRLAGAANQRVECLAAARRANRRYPDVIAPRVGPLDVDPAGLAGVFLMQTTGGGGGDPAGLAGDRRAHVSSLVLQLVNRLDGVTTCWRIDAAHAEREPLNAPRQLLLERFDGRIQPLIDDDLDGAGVAVAVTVEIAYPAIRRLIQHLTVHRR
jgi:hypothetical protein